MAADLHRAPSASTVSPDDVMIMPGGKVTMFMAILMFGEPGVEILYPDPGFPIYRSMIEFTGATPGADADPRGERLRLLGRRDAGADHAADAAASSSIRPPIRPAASRPRRRSTSSSPAWTRYPDVAIMSDEIYDQMTYDGLAQSDAADLSVDPRPADPAQRLVQDLCDDRLAAGLLRSGRASSTTMRAQARGQLAFLRQRAGPISPASRR